MGNNLPDFDVMTPAELSAWGWRHGGGSREVAATVLPGRPRGYVATVQALARMATLIGRAKRIRQEGGNIREAVQLEDEAEEIMVNELPDFARPGWNRP